MVRRVQRVCERRLVSGLEVLSAPQSFFYEDRAISSSLDSAPDGRTDDIWLCVAPAFLRDFVSASAENASICVSNEQAIGFWRGKLGSVINSDGGKIYRE